MKKSKKEYYGAYEGYQEEKYFKHVRMLINKSSEARYEVNFRFRASYGGSPLVVCEDADDTVTTNVLSDSSKMRNSVAIFDYDYKDELFKKAINYCNENKISCGYSNVNFDLWLILHKSMYNGCISDNNGYHKRLREVYNLPKNANIKDNDVIDKIVEQITLDDIRFAIVNAKRIEKEKEETGELFEKIHGHYTQPYIRLYEFVEKVLFDVGLL